MSLIVTEVYDALIEAGATERKAKAAAAAIPMVENLATRQDLTELKAATRQDLTELKAATKQDMAGLRVELKRDMAEFRAELKEDIGGLKRDMAVLKLAFAPAVLALLVKLVFFP